MRRPIADQSAEMAHSAARGMNDELTVILNSVVESLETLDPEHPARHLLLDLEIAAKRCVLISNGLMRYSQRQSMRLGPRDLLSFLES
jgi:hypothetical protein